MSANEVALNQQLADAQSQITQLTKLLEPLVKRIETLTSSSPKPYVVTTSTGCSETSRIVNQVEEYWKAAVSRRDDQNTTLQHQLERTRLQLQKVTETARLRKTKYNLRMHHIKQAYLQLRIATENASGNVDMQCVQDLDRYLGLCKQSSPSTSKDGSAVLSKHVSLSMSSVPSKRRNIQQETTNEPLTDITNSQEAAQNAEPMSNASVAKTEASSISADMMCSPSSEQTQIDPNDVQRLRPADSQASIQVLPTPPRKPPVIIELQSSPNSSQNMRSSPSLGALPSSDAADDAMLLNPSRRRGLSNPPSSEDTFQQRFHEDEPLRKTRSEVGASLLARFQSAQNPEPDGGSEFDFDTPKAKPRVTLNVGKPTELATPTPKAALQSILPLTASARLSSNAAPNSTAINRSERIVPWVTPHSAPKQSKLRFEAPGTPATPAFKKPTNAREEDQALRRQIDLFKQTVNKDELSRLVNENINAKRKRGGAAESTPTTDKKRKVENPKQYKGSGRYATMLTEEQYEYELNADMNNGLSYEHSDVVRGKAERKKLHGADCECCRGFYQAVGPLPKPTGPLWDGSPRALTTEELIADNIQEFSRHRHAGLEPTSTPPGYWDTTFPDTQTMQQYNAQGRAMAQRKEAIMRREAEKEDGLYKRKR